MAMELSFWPNNILEGKKTLYLCFLLLKETLAIYRQFV